jgi:serine/threonine protein kinase
MSALVGEFQFFHVFSLAKVLLAVHNPAMSPGIAHSPSPRLRPMPTRPPHPESLPTVPRTEGLPFTVDSPELAVSVESAIDLQSQSTKVQLATPDTAESTPAPPAEEPRRFGNYETRGELGVGGMGKVYRAVNLLTGQEVALKTLTTDARLGSSSSDRFLREARAASQLRHPNIVPIYHVDQAEGQIYFTMQLVGGGSLYEHMAEYRLPPPHSHRPGEKDDKSAESSGASQLSREQSRDRQTRIVSLMEKVARAVEEAHQHGIVHRDMKPGNILLEHGEPLVSDFGLARVTADSQADSAADCGAGGTRQHLTQAGALLGTPAYMSPEQYRNPAEVGPPTDVWALGVILYELLTGRKPFTGKHRDEISPKVLGETPTPPRTHNRHIDPALEAIVLKCLEKDLKGEKRRYQAAREVAEGLGGWRRGLRGLKPKRGSADSLLRVLVALVVVTIATVAVSTMAKYFGPTKDTRKGRENPEPLAASDPDLPLRLIREDLSHGKPVALLGEDKLPRWHQMRLENGPSVVPAVKDGYCFIRSLGHAVIELATEIPCERFRYEAEFKEEPTLARISYVGIAWGFVAQVSEHGTEDWYTRLTYSDGTRDGYPVATDFCRVIKGSARGKGLGHASSGERIFLPGLPAGEPRPWRRLAIEVEPDEIRVIFEGQLIESFSSADVVHKARGVLDRRPTAMIDVTKQYQPRRSVGLMLFNAAAYVRKAEITPLAQAR